MPSRPPGGVSLRLSARYPMMPAQRSGAAAASLEAAVRRPAPRWAWVGATVAARAYPDEDFVRARLGDRAPLEAEGLVLDRGLGGEREHPHTRGAPMWAPHPPSALIPSPRGPATSARARGAARPPSGP